MRVLISRFSALVLAFVYVLMLAAPQLALADVARLDRTVYSSTLNVASLADGVGETDSVTIVGAKLGDWCLASMGVDVVGITVTCAVSAADTVKVRFQNESTATVDLASTTLYVVLIHANLF